MLACRHYDPCPTCICMRRRIWSVCVVGQLQSVTIKLGKIPIRRLTCPLLPTFGNVRSIEWTRHSEMIPLNILICLYVTHKYSHWKLTEHAFALLSVRKFIFLTFQLSHPSRCSLLLVMEIYFWIRKTKLTHYLIFLH